MATVARVPFAEVGAARLQALESLKNRQNGAFGAVKDFKKYGVIKPSSLSKPAQLALPGKRSASVFEEDNNSDAENVDPTRLVESKKTKNNEGVFKKSMLSLKTLSNSSIRPTTTAIPSSPATRLYKAKRHGLSSAPKSTPFKRIDPPHHFSAPKSVAADALPFSIDAALHGTVGPNQDMLTSVAVPARVSLGRLRKPKVDKSMPKSWMFEIHEDSPDEHLSIVMEHETSVLDLSSEDEQTLAQQQEARGKENIPPPNDQLGNALPRATASLRRSGLSRAYSAASDAMAVDKEAGDRSPLSDLSPEEFFAEGLTRDSVVVVQEEEQTETADEGGVVARSTFGGDSVSSEVPNAKLDAQSTSIAGQTFDFTIAEDRDA